MNNKEIITQFGSLVNYKDPAEFWEAIKTQNKAKKWTITPVKIEFKDGQIVENSGQVKQLVELMQSWANDLITNAKDVDELEKATEIVREVYVWFSGSRKQLTKPLDEMKKNFTSLENEIKQIGITFKEKKETLLEEEYKQKALALYTRIQRYLEEIKKEHNVTIEVSLFKDFVERKKKTNIFTSKKELTKKIDDEIKAKINEILEPILKEREAQKLKEQDLQKLTLDLQDINTNALFVEELEAAKEKLTQLLNTVDMRYPNAVNEAGAQLNANIRLVEANIKRLQAEAEKEALRKAEEERKAAEAKKQEEIKKRAEEIQKAQQEVANAENAQTTEDSSKMEHTTTKYIIPPLKETEHTSKYKIPLREIEVIAAVEIKAASEDEAKEKAIEMFKQQLQFIELERV